MLNKNFNKIDKICSTNLKNNNTFKLTKFFVFAICLFSFVMVGCKNQPQKSLTTPQIVSIENGTIIFSKVEDAEYYVLNINGMSLNIDVDYNQFVKIVDDKIYYDATKIMVLGQEYSVKLQAQSSNSYDSKFCEAINYLYTPVATTPTNVKINGTILTWDTVENITYYKVKVTTNELDEHGVVDLNSKLEQVYIFSTNQFNFVSLLSDAGNYNFSVMSVYTDGEIISESNYSVKQTYTYKSKLFTPKISSITLQDEGLVMVAVSDRNANSCIVSCNGVSKSIYLTNSQNFATKNGNILQVNLTNLFSEFNFKSNMNFEFNIQSTFVQANEDYKFFYDSEVSSSYDIKNVISLSKPTLNLSDNVVTWSAVDGATKYKLLIIKENSYVEIFLDNDILTYTLSEPALAVLLQAQGSKYVKNSDYGIINNATFNFTSSKSEDSASWNVETKYSLVLTKNQVLTASSPFNYTSDMTNNKGDTIILLLVNKADKVGIADISLTNSAIKLNTPQIMQGQGFSSTNLFTFSFSPVENALGYQIKIIKEDNSESIIDNIYLTTTLDLSQYVQDENSNVKSVAVRAVADKNANYLDSDFSAICQVIRNKKLESPTFYTVGAIEKPVEAITANNITKYYLTFYGVENAIRYEVLINYNLKQISADIDNPTKLYKIDISNYVSIANNYDIKIRAIAGENTNFESSDYSNSIYTLKKQLAQVTDIVVRENDGKYTLSFAQVANAKEYKVRIVKLNDNSYSEYLSSFNLSNPFTVVDTCDLQEEYLIQGGIYYIYMSAVPLNTGLYAQSNESSDYALINKIETLSAPTNINIEKISSTSIKLSFIGDKNADFYSIVVTDTFKFDKEFIVYNSDKTGNLICDIGNCISFAGDYDIKVQAKINPTSDNAKNFESGACSYSTFEYRIDKSFDYERNTIELYSEKADNLIGSANELKTLIWYNYLYELNSNIRLQIKFSMLENETILDTLIRLSQEATEKQIYDFDNDETWNSYNEGTYISERLKYMIIKILSVYPEINCLDLRTISVEQNETELTRSNEFSIYFKNILEGEKTFDSVKTEVNDYGQAYSYLSSSQRRSSQSIFAIDNCEYMQVETTEQLCQAVQNGYQPKFYGSYETAKTVYENARAVLNTIISPLMTDVDKTTAIFDWIEHAVNNNKTANKTLSGLDESIDVYGKYIDYYLEAIFLQISTGTNTDSEFNLSYKYATSDSYSKAFALLCRIEGIKAIVVHGTRKGDNDATIRHSWNKVYVNGNWYIVDVTLSDNAIYYTDSNGIKLNNGNISSASHTYFLVSEGFLNSVAGVEEITQLSTIECNKNYNYYSNSSYQMTRKLASKVYLSNIQDFEYSKQYSSNSEYYNPQDNNTASSFDAYISDLILVALVDMNLKNSKYSSVELRIDKSDNANSETLSSSYQSAHISTVLSSLNNVLGNVVNIELKSVNYIYNSSEGCFVICLYFEKNV